MTSQLNPYLHFLDSAREAMEFYHTAFGGELTMTTFQEFQPMDDPNEGKKIMHAMLTAPNGIVFMASDAPAGMEGAVGSSMSMSLTGTNQPELSAYFEKLSVGGMVAVPLEKAP